MCGICGMYGFSDKNLLDRMCNSIAYRGPDDVGTYCDKLIGLGNRRLSIIDLKNGHQPIHNEDESIWSVYNGEIYNYKELRRSLEEKGHKFYTDADTEVLVHLYEEYGSSFPKVLRGIYAFAIWDCDKLSLLLSRDEIGVKPLYYTLTKDCLLFGSEIKAILEYEEIQRVLNYGSLDSFLTFGSVLGKETLFQGIMKLEPGNILIVDDKGVKIKNFWSVPNSILMGSEQKFVRDIRGLLTESVEMQLMSDVPLGALLSGGIDSSSVVGLMSNFTDIPIRTFTVGFGEVDDELRYARIVSEYFGTEHRELITQPKDILKTIPELVWHFDDLISDTAAVPTYLISELASKYVKVVLTGEGGDELFAGYSRDRIMSPSLWFLPASVKKRVFKRHISLFRDNHKDHIYSNPLMKNYNSYTIVDNYFKAHGDMLQKTMLFELKELLPNQLLSKVDRMSMAHSLEARVPILDKEMVRFCMCLPSSMRMKQFRSKWIFRKAMEGIVPKTILERKKKGFGAPLEKWFDTEVGEFIENILFESQTQRRKYLNYSYTRDLLSNTKVRKGNFFRLWSLLLLELWYRRFFESSK